MAGLYPWLLIATGAVADVLHGRTGPAWPAFAGLTAFAVLYMVSLWLRLRLGLLRPAIVLLAALTVLTLAMVLGFRHNMFSLFPLLSIATGAILPWRDDRPPVPAIAVAVLANAAALLGWYLHSKAAEIFSIWYSTLLAGFVIAVIFRLTAAVKELRETREELARQALTEVRQAVSGYRGQSSPASGARVVERIGVMFIVTLKYVADLERIDELLPVHREWLDAQYAAGWFVASGPLVPRTGGVILARGGDRDELEAVLATDPFGVAGLATYSVTEFTPVQAAPEFAGLAEG